MTSRLVPAVGLFLLAPLVAEFLLGNLPITAAPSLLLLAPLYGGGALLIREVARRTGRGWPTILLLGLAYGVLEEGLTTQSLFNPGYAGAHLLDHGYVPALGIAVPWTLFVLTLHTVWSIATPIALVETISRRSGPWLRTPGLVVTSVLFAIGVVGTTLVTLATDPFVAPVPRLLGALVVVVALVAIAHRLPRDRRLGSGDGGSAFRDADPRRAWHSAPRPVSVFLLTLAAGVAFELSPLGWWFVPIWALLATAALTLLPRWSRTPAWSSAHVLALAAGTTLTYAWHAFPEQPVLPASPTADLAGNVVLAAGAVALLLVAVRRVRETWRSGDLLHRFVPKSMGWSIMRTATKELRWRAER